jgi:hypothetical protein
MVKHFISKENVLVYCNSGVVKKYAQEYEVSIPVATERFEELKKFLFICATKEGNFSPSFVIDDIWHTFILFTKDYANFCNDYLGKFIHHAPDTEFSVESKSRNKNSYLNLYNNWVQEFGIPSETIMPIPVVSKVKKGGILVNMADCNAGCNCDSNPPTEAGDCSSDTSGAETACQNQD